jgi:predicted alpha/beta superfamily hydrolase
MTIPGKATIPATEVITVTSKNVNQEFRISVALPYSYPSKPRKRYPVIYLTDANYYFGMVTELTRIMPICGEVPETIVVGISYPVDEPLEAAFKRIGSLRARDFTPIVDRKWQKEDPSIKTGGAARFLQFIETELIPLVEAKFRASSTDRILAGHSLGGMFVLYTLFHQPELFKGYLAASPAVDYLDNVIFKYESKFAKTHKSLPVKLYLGVGDLEETIEVPAVSSMIQLAAHLESRKYQGFSLTKQIVDNCGHCASTAPTFQAGLQAVLT